MELSVNPRDHELTSHMTLTVLHLAGAAVSESFTTFPTESFIFIYIHEGTARCRERYRVSLSKGHNICTVDLALLVYATVCSHNRQTRVASLA